MVGFYDKGSGRHGFLFAAGVVSPIDIANATATIPTDINDALQIVGFYSDAAGVGHGFRLAGTSVVSIDVPGRNHHRRLPR